MRFERNCLASYGCVLPEEVMTSAELERRLAPVYERFRLHEGRLELMTGIRERRFWEPGALPSDGSTRAGRLALERAGVRPADIDYLVHTSVSRDFLEPATASVVHRNLGLSPRAGFCDISNACLGFLNGMVTVANMIELGQIKRGLIVAGESSRQLVETTIDQLLRTPNLTKKQLNLALASLTIGSGAVALVMAHESTSKGGPRLLGGVVRAATQHHELCQGSADTGFGDNAAMSMVTDSESLLNEGCALAGETWADFRRTLGWSNGDIDRCYTHQVGIAHRDRLYETLQRDPAGDFATLEFLGNVGSVSLPLTMAMGIEERPPSSGEQIAMLGIGSGLSCMMLGVEA
ncbi:MAG: 3-oxoacyl-ACP synthase III [Planctomycetota bacterium]|nr:3-oxoacyl-ACP synthase III [Planctomycetota bacterium]